MGTNKIICALCKEEKEPKSNTHYLTDSIIRTCLNENGKNTREKGFFFDFSNPAIHYGFQRNTNSEKIKNFLKREITDEEIEEAKKQIPFSVDDKFCKDCENKFTAIETNFISKYLDFFRDHKFTDSLVIFEDKKVIKSFFLLQIWRTHICNTDFYLESETCEKIRNIIYNNDSIEENTLNEFPISITYLTTPTIQDYTANTVGYLPNNINPNIIIMNDFVIQFFHNSQSVKFFDFFGLNTLENYKDYINTNSEKFIFKIFNNEEREIFNRKIQEKNVERFMEYYSSIFKELHIKCFLKPAPLYLIKEFFKYLEGEENLTHENMQTLMTNFINKKV